MRRMNVALRWVGVLMILAGAAAVQAEVRLPAILSDHMLIQSGVPTVLWGWADAKEEVTVQCGDLLITAVNDNGRWQATLPPQNAGAVPDITIAGTNTLTIKDVLAGDVWVCSGQSNMEWTVQNSDHKDKEIPAANFPSIRLFLVTKARADNPKDDVSGKWELCSPKTVGRFSGVGYFFGRELHQKLNIPIGLIGTYWGGTPLEAWASLPAMQADPDFSPLVTYRQTYPQEYPALLKKYESDLAAWQKKVAGAKAAGQPEPDPKNQPRKPLEPNKVLHMAGVLYNGMVHPLRHYRIHGVIWYQGEANTRRAAQYRKLLPALIADWRKTWDQSDLPFGIVQLANHLPRQNQLSDSDWAVVREAQALAAAKVPHTGLALAIDVGLADNIHPTNKQTVGQRLALWARAQVYGEKIVYSGPVYTGMKIENDAARLSFAHLGAGLMAKGDKLTGFAIAGEDRSFVWAEAKIDGDTIVVRSPQVAKPVAVRYAWANNPECNLYNRDGLPAVPFRTDDWEKSSNP